MTSERGACPFVDIEGFLCGRPLEDAKPPRDHFPVALWACELGHTVQEVADTDTFDAGPYADQRPKKKP